MKLSIQSLTIQEVEKVHETLMAWLLDDPSEGVLDLGSVERIDMCGIQLLLSLKNSLNEMGITLHLSGLSSYLVDSFNLSGCTPILVSHNE